MHENSHKIVRLSCHLPDKQMVYFQQGEEEPATNTDSHLTAWFRLNDECSAAHDLVYHEIVQHYTFQKGSIYATSPPDIERFHLRLLLLHVHGAKKKNAALHEDLSQTIVNITAQFVMF